MGVDLFVPLLLAALPLAIAVDVITSPVQLGVVGFHGIKRSMDHEGIAQQQRDRSDAIHTPP